MARAYAGGAVLLGIRRIPRIRPRETLHQNRDDGLVLAGSIRIELVDPLQNPRGGGQSHGCRHCRDVQVVADLVSLDDQVGLGSQRLGSGGDASRAVLALRPVDDERAGLQRHGTAELCHVHGRFVARGHDACVIRSDNALGELAVHQ